jgi:hypothetical protein
VRTVPIPALSHITVGWAARHWDDLSPLATEFATLVAADQPHQYTGSSVSHQ